MVSLGRYDLHVVMTMVGIFGGMYNRFYFLIIEHSLYIYICTYGI